MTQENKNTIALSVFGLIILLLFIYSETKEKSLEENKITTIGKIIEIKMCGKPATDCIKFEYLVNEKWIEGTDPERAAYPEYIRDGEAEIGKYYKVVYDRTDINNSKIIITKKPLTEMQTEKYLY